MKTPASGKKLIEEFKVLYAEFYSNRKAYDDFVKSIVTLCTQFKNDIVYMNKALKILKSEFTQFNVTIPSTTNLFGSIQDPTYVDVLDLNDNCKDLNEKFEQLQESIKSFATLGGDKSPESVEIGNLTFTAREDLKVWVLKQIAEKEDGSFLFGVFLDVYSFLARIQTYGESKDTMLKNLDLNQRTKMTSDEVTTLGAFTNMVPAIFGRPSGIIRRFPVPRLLLFLPCEKRRIGKLNPGKEASHI